MSRSQLFFFVVALFMSVVTIQIVLCGQTFVHVGATWWRDGPPLPPLGPNEADDGGRLSAAHIVQRVTLPDDPEEAKEVLRGALARARDEELPVSIAGARQSQGGQTIAAHGLQLDLSSYRHLSLKGDVLTVGSGARWSEVLPYLHERGRSVAVMQGYHDFSVGGSLSVNASGWMVGAPPIASTVQSFTLMQADGAVIHCSRDQNEELFSLVIGGYGLFGVVLEVSLETTPDVWLWVERSQVPATSLSEVWREEVLKDPDIALAVALISPAPSTLLEEAALSVYRRASDQTPP